MTKTIAELYQELEQEWDSAVISSENAIINSVLNIFEINDTLTIGKRHPTVFIDDVNQLEAEFVESCVESKILLKPAPKRVKQVMIKSRSATQPRRIQESSKKSSVDILKLLQASTKTKQKLNAKR